MTEQERTQLEKEILHEQYSAHKEYTEYMAKIQMMNQKLREPKRCLPAFRLIVAWSRPAGGRTAKGAFFSAFTC